jgi:hypothetical protein
MSLAGDLPVHFTPDKGQILNHSSGIGALYVFMFHYVRNY